MKFLCCFRFWVLIWIALVHSKHQEKTFRRNRPIIDPIECPSSISPFGCRRVPRDSDAMTRDTFRQFVSGGLTEVMWRIDAIGYNTIENVFPNYKIQCSFKEIGNEMVTLGAKFRDSKTEGANCVVQPGSTSPVGRFNSSKRAVMDFDSPLAEPVGLSPIRYWMMSDHPEDYILLYGCQNRNAIRNGVCYGRWYLDINLFAHKLDNPPMKCIVDEMWRKLGLRFDHPANTLVSIGYPCPGDVNA